MKIPRLWLGMTMVLLMIALCPVEGATTAAPLIPVTRDFTLKNGLRVVLSVDHSRPVISIVTLFDVGSRHEVKGKSGFAHLFEHMMFEGSKNVSKEDLSRYLDTMGGDVNAQTATDYTIYYELVPSNMLERVLWIESDRLRSLDVTDENFKNQLETVKEEKRSSYDNQPYMPAYLKTEEMLFDNWSNGHPVIGSFCDLESSSAATARAFFKSHYAPNRACIAIVGDMDPDETEKLIRKYYATIPSIPGLAPPPVNEQIPGRAKATVIKDEYAEMPGIFFAWKTDGMRQADYFAFDIIEKLLIDSKSTRLYQRLVKDDKTALSVQNYSEERRGTAEFIVFAVCKEGVNPKRIKTAVMDEIDKLKQGKISSQELQMAKNQILTDMFAGDGSSSLQSTLGRAQILAEYTLFFGSPKLLDSDISRYMAVSVSDIQRAAKRLFPANSATIVDVVPTGKI